MDLFRHNRHPCSIRRCLMLALFIMLTHLSSLTSAACDTMKVFNEDKEVTDKVCKEEYRTHECDDFTETHNITFLPKDNMRGASVQGPGKLQILAYSIAIANNKSEEIYYPSLKCAWNSPSSDTARESITGFYMWIQSDDQEQTVCRIFSIDHTQYKYDKLRFEYDYEQISTAEGRNYTVRVYSLPVPARHLLATDWMGDRDNYKSQIVTTKDPFYWKAIGSAHWKTSITVEPHLLDRSIDVWFTLPDPALNFHFTHFTVGLVDAGISPYDPIKLKVVRIDPASDAGHYKFTNLSPTVWYQVYVSVKDQHLNIPSKCQCFLKMETDFGPITSCEGSCSKSWSAFFDLNFNVTRNPKLVTHASLPTTDSKVTHTPLQTTDSNVTHTPLPTLQTTDPVTTPFSTLNTSVNVSNDKALDKDTIYIIVGVAVGIQGIIPIAGFIFWKYRNERLRKSHDRLTIVDRGPVELEPITPKCPSLRRRRVFLLYSSDHKYHREMMKQFTIFLQTHCKCDVEDTSEFDANQFNGRAHFWLRDKFNKCDLIIFFDSPGASHRLEEYGNKQEYYAKEKGPHGDLFNLGLHYMCSEVIEKRLSERAMIVSLTEERCQTVCLGVLKEWVLPRDLSPFQQQLHSLNAASIDSYKSFLPMTDQFQPELPYVSDLIESIKDVAMFEKNNPDWFSQHFESIMKPKKEIIFPCDDSSYGSMNGSENRSITPPLTSSDNLDLPQLPTDERSICITVVTDPPGFLDEYTGNGDNFAVSTNVKRSDEWNCYSKTASENKDLVPPVNMSKINPKNTSIAIGGFNHKTNQSNGSGNVQTSEEMVPPCNQSEIVVDNLSMAIGRQNCNLIESTSDEMSTGHAIKPPVDLSELNFENCSLALGQLNQKGVFAAVSGTISNSFQPTKDLIHSNEEGLNPPRDDLPPLYDDGFSEILNNNNSDFTEKNNNDGNIPLSSKRQVTERNNDNHHYHQTDTINPPVDTIPVEKLDNFSQVLNCEINQISFSQTAAEGRRKKLQEHGKQQLDVPVHPPERDISKDIDSFSCALQNFNTKSKEDFISSCKCDNDIFIV